MGQSLLEFLYSTNREITVIILCAMLPMDAVLFWLMSRFGRMARLLFGATIIATFAWSLSWFIEPPRPPSLEPVMRELALLVLLSTKCYRIVQAMKPRSERRSDTLLTPVVTRRDRSLSLLAGLIALSLSSAIALSFWLFSAYRHTEALKEQQIEAVNMAGNMLAEFNSMVKRFEAKQDAILNVSQHNGTLISKSIEQGVVGIDMAQKAAGKAEGVARRLKNTDQATRREIDRLRRVPSPKPIRRDTAAGSWYDQLKKRLMPKSSYLPDEPYLRNSPIRPDSLYSVHHKPKTHD